MFLENKCCYFTGATMEEFRMIATMQSIRSITKLDGKVKKVIKSVDVEEVIELFNEQVKVLKEHIFVKRTQNKHDNQLKENLKKNELFIIHIST